ncbi:MAG: IPT/TIG domain-containing protein [Saprospiraceae bacterium]|nr:IPT/TIG domain-containing protein [Saprospiraceae bacterium]
MKSNVFLIFSFLFFFLACENNEPAFEVSVYTEEVVFTSGEKVIITGRVLSTDDVNISDHGFQISEDENFNSPEILSLGAKTVPGRFVGEYADLNIESDYYCRAYIIEEGSEKTGNILPFSTLNPRIKDFSPKEGSQNNKIIIEGVNLTSDTYVLWNDQTITPSKIIEESFLEIQVPAPENLPFATLKVVSQGQTLEFPDRFEYIIGSWGDGGSIVDTNKNNNHIYFEDLDYFYYGLGINREFNGPSPKIFRLNKTTLIRDEFEHEGFATEGSFFTPNGYFGGGSLSLVKEANTTLLNNSQFFALDGDKTKRLADIPALLYQAIAFAHDNFIYIYGGENQGRERNTNIYRYSIENDFWETMGSSPYSPLNEYPYFTIGNKNYFITESGQLNSHDILSDEWEVHAQYPDIVKKDGIQVVFQGNAYVGLQDITRKVFEYVPTEDRWKKKKSNPTLEPSVTLGTWIDDNQITVMRTNSGNGESRFFWTFDPFFF